MLIFKNLIKLLFLFMKILRKSKGHVFIYFFKEIFQFIDMQLAWMVDWEIINISFDFTYSFIIQLFYEMLIDLIKF